MTDIVMPRLSDTMEEGTILRWLKRSGEQVSRGEELVEIETDKASMTYESDQQGVLEIVAHEGDTLPIGEVIAHVAQAVASAAPAGDAIAPAGSRATTNGEAGHELQPAQQPSGAAQPREAPLEGAAGTFPAALAASAPAAAPQTPGHRLKVSPLARRVAQEREVALEGLSGSGPGGRIVKADVEAARRSAPPPPPPSARLAQPSAPAGAQGLARAAPSISLQPPGPQQGPARQASHAEQPVPSQAVPVPSQAEPPSPPGVAPGSPAESREMAAASAPAPEAVLTAKGETTVHELSRTQQLIARRMAESKATIPHFALQAEIDMEECIGLRTELARHVQSAAPATPGGGAPGSAEGRPPSYNDMIVKACAIALREHPRVNGSYRDGRVHLHARVNVGVAVAVDHEDPWQSALIVPTVFDADIKSLGEIARESRTLASRVRDGEITPPELSGGTFTVSNLGMYGVRSFSAIINPPQAAILSVGALERRPAVVGDAIVARHSMAVTLACDHRMLYGADAARFLARVRELLEAPSALLL